jgi:tRNA dimethylallyltransferase
VAVLLGQMTVEQAKVQMRRLTRIFVRRQANWFKLDDPEIHWFDVEDSSQNEIVTLIRTTFKEVE